jgi:hypothetical protein
MLFMALPSVLFSQNFDNIIVDFLHRLTAKHKNVESLEISNIETRTVPGEEEGEWVMLISFNNPREREVFSKVLEDENIPYGYFPGRW